MLVQVTIENFLSFKDETTFSMLGVNSDASHLAHLAVDVAGKGKSLLPVAAIYGANAAGKSNLIKAIDFAQDLIVEGTRSGKAIPVSTFKLGDYSKKPSKFEFIFTYENAQYSYGFTLNSSQILEEWLYGIPRNKKREVQYFVRTTSESKETKIEYGSILRGKGDKEKQFLEFIAKGTRPNQLFLTEAVERNVTVLMPIVYWFKRVLTIIPSDPRSIGLKIGILSSEEFTSFLGKFLKFSGTGIDSIGVEEVALDFDAHFPEMSENMREELIQQLAGSSEDSTIVLEDPGKRYLLMKRDGGQISLMQLKTKHLNDKN